MIHFLQRGVSSTSPNPQAGGPPLVGCPRLLIQNIRSYPPYLEAVPPSLLPMKAKLVLMAIKRRDTISSFSQVLISIAINLTFIGICVITCNF
jgi:hypothetical protein